MGYNGERCEAYNTILLVSSELSETAAFYASGQCLPIVYMPGQHWRGTHAAAPPARKTSGM
jgi:hypothetical protein